MKIAPLQPQGIAFEEVSVAMQMDESNNPISAEGFDFSNVNFNCEVGHGQVFAPEQENKDNDSILVSIKLEITNETGKIAPYRINVKVVGIFKWIIPNTPEVERRDLLVVNGASILYGAAREMVLTVTSRSIAGGLVLPSFNFTDNKPSEMHHTETITQSQSIPLTRKKRSTKLSHDLRK